MSDAEALGAAVTIWLAVVLLTLAGDYASSVRVVNREKPGGVEGHADEPKREAYGERDEAPNRTIPSSPYVRGFAAERERRQRMEPALAGIKPGLGFSRFAQIKSFLSARIPAFVVRVVGRHVSSLMGKQSRKERPPRLWPCEKAVLAGFEPRNASSRTPRDTTEGPEDSTGVTAGETALVPAATVPEEVEGGARGRDTIQSVGIANDGPGDTSPAPGPFAAESGRAVWDRSQSGTRGISPDREAARPLAVTRQD